jgi:signal peptidase I
MSSPAAPAAIAKTPPTTRRLLGRLYRFAVGTFALLGVATVVRPFLCDISTIASGSMAPTLQGDARAGDWVLSEKVSFWFRDPQRWDIIQFTNEEGLQVMKRVMALPGESIVVRLNHAEVDGKILRPPPGIPTIKYYAFGNVFGGKPFPVTEGYYVLGDDSQDSQDSRYEGPIKPDQIHARAWLILWPLNRFGWVR